MRRGARRAGPAGVHGYSTGTAQAVLDYAPPGARLVFSCGWHITRDGAGCVLVEAQGGREGLRPARAARSLRRPRRPGRGVPASVCERHALDGRARKRPRGGREPGSARVEPACGRSDPREQPDAPRGLRPVHGGGSRERRARPRGARRSSAARRPQRSLTARTLDARVRCTSLFVGFARSRVASGLLTVSCAAFPGCSWYAGRERSCRG